MKNESLNLYRLTFESKIDMYVEFLFLQELFKKIQPNIFECSRSKILQRFGNDAAFRITFIEIAKKCNQEKFKLELVSSFSRTDYKRFENTWLNYGIIAVYSGSNVREASFYRPYFFFTNSQQYNDFNNQKYIKNYLKQNNFTGTWTSICRITSSQDVLQYLANGKRIWIGGHAYLQLQNEVVFPMLNPSMHTAWGDENFDFESLVFHEAFQDATKENNTHWVYPVLIELTKSKILNSEII